MRTVTIALPSGEVVLVDAADADLVRRFRWQKHDNRGAVYAGRNVRRPDGSRTRQLMHTLITGWAFVDHRNGNGLDNRRVNLRQATHQQNHQNIAAQPGRTSRYKGVHWDPQRCRWRAQIKVDGRHVWRRRFSNEEEAARAYDTAAREHFGEFAVLNFPSSGRTRCPDRNCPYRPVSKRRPPVRAGGRESEVAVTTSTDPTTDTQPATDIDLLEMLARARREGCPWPTGASVDWQPEAHIHVHDKGEAERWVGWWASKGAHTWTSHKNIQDRSIHHYQVGQYRGQKISVVHLTRLAAPVEVTAP